MENTNKFKVGDRVRVKPLSWFKENYSNFDIEGFNTENLYITEEMLRKVGSVIKIKKDRLTYSLTYSDGYICEDDWMWLEDWLEPALSTKKQLKEEIKEKQRELSKIYKEEKLQLERGYLDDVETWKEAINKLKELNEGFNGTFVLIDDDVYFQLSVKNDFFKDDGIPKLISK